jgi:hypothetical protein
MELADRVPSLNPPELKLEDPSSGDVRLHATVSFDQPGNETEEKEAKELSAPLTGSGYSPRSAKRIEDVIGHPVILLPGGGGDLSLPVEYEPVLRPGEAVSVLVAWGMSPLLLRVPLQRYRRTAASSPSHTRSPTGGLWPSPWQGPGYTRLCQAWIRPSRSEHRPP